MLNKIPFQLAVIDLDNTLYAADNGVFSRMDAQMNNFIQRELKLDFEQANAMRLKYWRQYGSTLRGLMLHHGQDAEAFLSEAHDIAAHELLMPDPSLSHTLAQMQVRKVIHTNGTREHAEKILDVLGVAHHFAKIYDIRFNEYQPKPCVATLQHLFAMEQIQGRDVLVIDDMPNNLAAAKKTGAKTAWVHVDAAKQAHEWDIAATSFANLLGSEASR